MPTILKQLVGILEQYSDGKLTSEYFAQAIIDIWAAVRDEISEAEEENPALKAQGQDLIQKRLSQTIDAEEFSQQYKRLFMEISKHCSVQAFSKEDEVIHRLFTAAEGYRSSAKERETWNTEDEDLLQSAHQALHILGSTAGNV